MTTTHQVVFELLNFPYRHPRLTTKPMEMRVVQNIQEAMSMKVI
jgi:hypothetical protein